MTDTDYLRYLYKNSEGREKFTVLNEKILSNQMGFKFLANDFLFEAFNKKIVQFVESGVADLIIRNESRFKDTNFENLEPLILTLSHLGVWFQILLVFLSVGSLCFVLEFILGKLIKFMSGFRWRCRCQCRFRCVRYFFPVLVLFKNPVLVHLRCRCF